MASGIKNVVRQTEPQLSYDPVVIAIVGFEREVTHRTTDRQEEVLVSSLEVHVLRVVTTYSERNDTKSGENKIISFCYCLSIIMFGRAILSQRIFEK